jgi:glycosyltransferase involved in cell wall biosynthesis
LRVATCILAKNEAATIKVLIAQMVRQSLFHRPDLTIDVHLVANGCTDDTAAQATAVAAEFEGTNARLYVHDLAKGGKSRSWNKAVHELIEPGADYLLFLDSDITLINDRILEDLLATLEEAPQAKACSGYPIKDIENKQRKTVLDHFSLTVSRQNPVDGVINGSLYLTRAGELRDVWLPDETPCEDGFLNAMLATAGFTQAPEATRVIAMNRPTHYYRAHSSSEFILHERRIIVGTMINRWIFEHLWSLRLHEPAGKLIRQLNREKPNWVDLLVAERVSRKAWVVSNDILFGRLSLRGREASWKLPLQLAAGVLATMLTIAPATAANRRLKQFGAAATW